MFIGGFFGFILDNTIPGMKKVNQIKSISYQTIAIITVSQIKK